MTYIASESFRSLGGERFSFGQEIGSLEYNKLTREEKMKFRRKYSSDDDYAPKSSPDQGIYWNPLPDYGDFPSSSSQSESSPSFGGYEGGSSGGGGSDSSWSDSGSSDSGSSDGGGGGDGGD